MAYQGGRRVCDEWVIDFLRLFESIEKTGYLGLLLPEDLLRG